MLVVNVCVVCVACCVLWLSRVISVGGILDMVEMDTRGTSDTTTPQATPILYPSTCHTHPSHAWCIYGCMCVLNACLSPFDPSCRVVSENRIRTAHDTRRPTTHTHTANKNTRVVGTERSCVLWCRVTLYLCFCGGRICLLLFSSFFSVCFRLWSLCLFFPPCALSFGCRITAITEPNTRAQQHTRTNKNTRKRCKAEASRHQRERV